jgi:DnaJ-class molecular chaperone
MSPAWIRIKKPAKDVLEYLRYSIPSTHRFYDDKESSWFVHPEYSAQVQQLTGFPVTVLPPEPDPYAVLHLREGAPDFIIKAAWRELAKRLHPDHGGNASDFAAAKAAYDKLTKGES